MSKMLRNGIVVFAAICAVVLVIFCIELFVLNRNPDDGAGNEPSLSESAANSGGESSGGQENPPDKQQEPGKGAGQTGNGAKDQPTQPPPPPTGTRKERLVSADTKLVLYIDEDVFDESEQNEGYLYKYKGVGTATLEITIAYIQFDAGSFAGSFLDGYVGPGGTSAGETSYIGRSPLEGIHVSGELDGEKYEAWVYSFPDADDWGVSFTLHYRSDEQRDALYTILDSMSMIPA